jgi:DNA-directed RNA polymerase specialized sigma24 family protein
MPPRSIEDLFRCWRATGDADLLGRVYDRTAARLLVVASHLCHDIDRAEDAVQGTFLAALQHAGRWYGRRPLEPWLLGILGNLVARGRRERARAAVDLPDDLTVAHDPTAVAAGAEFDAAVDRAIDELPELYRPVL